MKTSENTRSLERARLYRYRDAALLCTVPGVQCVSIERLIYLLLLAVGKSVRGSFFGKTIFCTCFHWPPPLSRVIRYLVSSSALIPGIRALVRHHAHSELYQFRVLRINLSLQWTSHRTASAIAMLWKFFVPLGLRCCWRLLAILIQPKVIPFDVENTKSSE